MESEDSNRNPKRSTRKKRAQSPSDSMEVSNLTIRVLPEEIIFEILSRLPVKSLLRFRSVSKSWLALISSSEFIKAHLSFTVNNKSKEDTHHMLIVGLRGDEWGFIGCSVKSLLYNSVTEGFDLDSPLEDASGYICIVGSCNGLLFLAHYPNYYLLWNPATGKHKNLPDFRPRYKDSYSIYGFGYDEFRDDYKVVGIFYDSGGSDGVEVKMYSLKSDSWTSVDYCWEILNASESYRKERLDAPGLFVNGKLHWDTIISGPNFSRVRPGKNIISFDLANEKWEKMKKPIYGPGDSNLHVGTLGSDLCVHTDNMGKRFGVWLMKEYGVKESWTKVFHVKYPKYQLFNPPLFMSDKGQILTVFGSGFMIYNSKDDSFRYPDVINCDDCCGVRIYIESLVCPFSTEGTEKATKERVK